MFLSPESWDDNDLHLRRSSSVDSTVSTGSTASTSLALNVATSTQGGARTQMNLQKELIVPTMKMNNLHLDGYANGDDRDDDDGNGNRDRDRDRDSIHFRRRADQEVAAGRVASLDLLDMDDALADVDMPLFDPDVFEERSLSVLDNIGGVNGVYLVTDKRGRKWVYKPASQEGFKTQAVHTTRIGGAADGGMDASADAGAGSSLVAVSPLSTPPPASSCLSAHTVTTVTVHTPHRARAHPPLLWTAPSSADTKSGSNRPEHGHAHMTVPHPLVRSQTGGGSSSSSSYSRDFSVSGTGASTGTKTLLIKEPLKRGVILGEAVKKEVAAYVLDHDHFSQVPKTLNIFSQVADRIVVAGSLQLFVPDTVGSAEDWGPDKFPVDEVHKVGVLDIRILNLDRHLGNILVTKDKHNGAFSLVPIDHGYCLPDFRQISDVQFQWLNFKQALHPFSQKTLDYIASLNPGADALTLVNHGISKESAVSCIVATLLLQRGAARGLNLWQIAVMIQRPFTLYSTNSYCPSTTSSTGTAVPAAASVSASASAQFPSLRDDGQEADHFSDSAASRANSHLPSGLPLPPSSASSPSSSSSAWASLLASESAPFLRPPVYVDVSSEALASDASQRNAVAGAAFAVDGEEMLAGDDRSLTHREAGRGNGTAAHADADAGGSSSSWYHHTHSYGLVGPKHLFSPVRPQPMEHATDLDQDDLDRWKTDMPQTGVDGDGGIDAKEKRGMGITPPSPPPHPDVNRQSVLEQIVSRALTSMEKEDARESDRDTYRERDRGGRNTTSSGNRDGDRHSSDVSVRCRRVGSGGSGSGSGSEDLGDWHTGGHAPAYAQLVEETEEQDAASGAVNADVDAGENDDKEEEEEDDEENDEDDEDDEEEEEDGESTTLSPRGRRISSSSSSTSSSATSSSAPSPRRFKGREPFSASASSSSSRRPFSALSRSASASLDEYDMNHARVLDAHVTAEEGTWEHDQDAVLAYRDRDKRDSRRISGRSGSGGGGSASQALVPPKAKVGKGGSKKKVWIERFLLAVIHEIDKELAKVAQQAGVLELDSSASESASAASASSPAAEEARASSSSEMLDTSSVAAKTSSAATSAAMEAPA